uniref:RING-type E3 ubiquitin transferase n=1 Tax=Falco tinnunculus TaxID=100819 RepID=A0A8C4TRD6_FALTI
MVTELDDCCPICLDSWEEASYVMPCLHKFCYTCILRWAENKPECPLCKGRVSSILHLPAVLCLMCPRTPLGLLAPRAHC